jgi:molybdopterin-binding protein
VDLLKLTEAARLMNVSYPTLKQWIYRGKVRAVKTPGGHYRIPQTEVDRLTQATASVKKSADRPAQPKGIRAISGRNKLLGVITEVRYEGLLAQVTMDIGGQTVTAIITRGACEDLGLEKGVEAYALMKATEVMLIRA